MKGGLASALGLADSVETTIIAFKTIVLLAFGLIGPGNFLTKIAIFDLLP